MEVMIWVVVIWIAWMLFKGKMQRDAIREALNEIRVNALKNRKTIIETLSSSTYQTYIDGEEDIVKATIAKLIFQQLNYQGLRTEYIQGNIKLSILFNQTVNDVYEAIH